MSRAGRALAALAAVALAAGPGAAGAAPGRGPLAQADTVVRELRIPATAIRPGGAPALPQPLILDIGPGGAIQIAEGGDEPALTRQPIAALDAGRLERLRRARSLRLEGRLDEARRVIEPLLAEEPHHALLLYERARLHVAESRWDALDRLARAERAFQADSLLLARELVLAEEQLRRPREAAATALECWIASADQGEWAFHTLARLAPADERGVRELLRRAAERLPQRDDLVRGHARLEWKLGADQAAMRVLEAADGPGLATPLRWTFADELLRLQSGRDSTGAGEALISLAADTRLDAGRRLVAARRAWDLHRARGTERAAAPRIHRALGDVAPARWHPDLIVGLARGLREAGLTAESRALLDAPSLRGAQLAQATLERALADLRDGPPEKALPALRAASATSAEARFRYAEALFFAGQSDSAKSMYRQVSENPSDPFAGAALERIYLIEDSPARPALEAIGQMAWHDWRGDVKAALAVADSLFRTLSPGPLWSQVALFQSERLESEGRYAEALAPLLAVATQRPGDRLAPLARQRAGDLYLHRLKDPREALAQYEECLTRYPRAWNSAEVRRRLEALRKQRF